MVEKKIVGEASPTITPLPGNTFCARSVQQHSETGQIVLRTWWVTAQTATASHRHRIAADVAALQAVKHPSFVPPQEVQIHPQSICLLSSLPASHPLDAYLREQFLQPLPQQEALAILTQLGQALAALHQQGRTHGHLTPHTIWISATGQVYLTEARMNSVLACIEHYQPALDQQCPRCWYLAPEQFHGTYRPQSDQYALGCLAYQLFTGHLPFPGTARATLLQKHHRDLPKPLTHFHPTLPAALDAAVQKALAKRPEERHESMHAFLLALAAETSLEQSEQTAVTTDIATQPTIPLPTAETVAPLPVADISAPSEQAADPEEGDESSKASTTVLPIAAAAHASPSPHRALPPRVAHGGKRMIVLALGLLVLVLLGTLGGWEWVAAGHAGQHKQSISTGVPAGPESPAQGQATATVVPSPTSAVMPGALGPPVPGTSLSPTPAAAPAAAITPLLECVTLTGNSLLAWFGSVNPNPFAVTIALGSQNVISPASFDGSQPTRFAPGAQQQVFELTFSRRQTVRWSLEGVTVTASSASPRC